MINKTDCISPKNFRRLNSQAGFSLIVVLVFLIMLSMIGATSMQTAGLEERMAGNGRDRGLAFEAAEGTLRIAEKAASLATSASFTPTKCIGGFCDTGYAPADPVAYNWLTGTTHVALDASANGLPPSLSSKAGYYVEKLYTVTVKIGGKDVKRTLMRITAHSAGRDANTQVTLQSVIYQE